MQSVNNDHCEKPKDNIAMPNNQELICPVVDINTGNVCGEKTGLQILNEFRQLYENRIQNINPNSDNEVQERMNIMMEWIRDLDAQNRMLVSTVEELEEAACCRVKMLEEKLKNTSSALTDSISQYANPSGSILDHLHERIDKLEINARKSQERIQNLRSDIRGLLELIRRMVNENSWRLDGITFFEINRRDIPIPDGSMYDQAMGDNKNIDILTQQLQFLNENEQKSIEYQHKLQHKVTYLSEELQDREDKLQKLKSKFDELRDSFKRRTEASADFNNDIIRLLGMEESDFITIENSDEDIQEEVVNPNDVEVCRLQNELEEKTREVTRLTKQFKELEKESLESREALAQEVAEKHDTAMQFKQKVDELEEYGRRLTIQLKYKEDLNDQLRKESKLLKIKMASMSSKSPTKVHMNASPPLQRITWSENISGEVSGQMKAPNGSLLSTYPELKTILINEHRVLKETIQELHDVWYNTTLMEKATYDKYLAAGQSKVDDILAMLEKYRSQVNERSDQESSTGGTLHCRDKLMKVIDALSDLCMDKNRVILELDVVLQEVRAKNDEICDSLGTENIDRQNPDVSPQQFEAMREFRVCTVEAQAAIEDLREEMEMMMCNLNCRHQLFVDLCTSIKTMQDVIARTKQNISTVINSVKAHVEEKIAGDDTIKISQEKLKDLKNEINVARSKLSSSADHSEHEFDIHNRSYDRLVDEVESIVSNLKVFIAKDDHSLTLLEELHDHVNNVEESLDKLQTDVDRVLQENKIAQKIVDDKATRLDKLEQELDYAHTKMQDTLETIVIISQQNESSNGHSTSTDDTLTVNESDGNSPQTMVEIDKLKNSLSSKDKLLEHKDEIIRIQKDSMEMTQGEYKDLRQRLQSKIDAQVAVINQYLEEKMQLLEQNRLQNQTIKHLQDAVVEAKKNLNRQLPQKSAMDLGGGDSWSPISPPVLNNGNENTMIYGRDIEHEMEHILTENIELKSQLIAYREDLYTMMRSEKRRNQMEGPYSCKVYPCLQSTNESKNKLKEYEKLLREYSEKLHVTQILLKEKSEEMAKLEADYQMINNEWSIVKAENKTYEMCRENSSYTLQRKIEELQNDLHIVGDNYQRVCMDYEKSQKQLLDAATREIELQRSLSETLENTTKNDTINDLRDLTNMLNLELEDTRTELNRKECALLHAQDVCKSSLEQIELLTRQGEWLEERNIELSGMNDYLLHQVQDTRKINQYLKKHVGKSTMKTKSEESSTQILMLSQKKIHGDGLWGRARRKTIGRCKRHSYRSARPYSSDITLSTCCSIRTITTTTRASMGGNSL